MRRRHAGRPGLGGRSADAGPAAQRALVLAVRLGRARPDAAEERHLLHWLVRAAHAEGRRVRFFGIPERPRRVRGALWTELTAAGVDVIGSRRLWALRRHLRRRHPVLRWSAVAGRAGEPRCGAAHDGRGSSGGTARAARRPVRRAAADSGAAPGTAGTDSIGSWYRELTPWVRRLRNVTRN